MWCLLRGGVAITLVRARTGGRSSESVDSGRRDDRAVAEVGDAAGKLALVEQLEHQMDAVGERPLAATDEHGHHEQLQLVDQPGRERVCRELGAPDAQVAASPPP